MLRYILEICDTVASVGIWDDSLGMFQAPSVFENPQKSRGKALQISFDTWDLVRKGCQYCLWGPRSRLCRGDEVDLLNQPIFQVWTSCTLSSQQSHWGLQQKGLQRTRFGYYRITEPLVQTPPNLRNPILEPPTARTILEIHKALNNDSSK